MSESNSPSDITELPSGDIPPVDEKPVSGPNEPNTPVIIPEPPEKPVVNPLDYSPYGRPAPQWLRDAETATAHIGMDSEELIQEWGHYFDLILNAPWNSIYSDMYEETGGLGASYFDPYHVFGNREIAVIDANGEPVQSDYIEPGRNDLYVVCHSAPEVTLPWAYDYIDKAMSFGSRGMFFDDIRKPYDHIADAYNTCYSTSHEHTLTGTNTENYFSSTLPAIYDYVKSKDPSFIVFLNGGIPHIPDSEPDSAKNLWPFSDGLMWEHAIYDSTTRKWTSWAVMESYGAIFSEAVKNGKAEVALTWCYEQMSKHKALMAGVMTLAYARMYDLIWSDYYSLYRSDIDRDVLKELYSVKTGPAAALGTYYGKVSDEVTGAGLEGVSVESGSQRTVTDANGNFNIVMPVNEYTVTLSRNGYETAEQTVQGHNMNLPMKRVEDGTVYYVSVFGSNENDGLTQKSAWRSINYGDAMQLLKPGDTVMVTEGTYLVPNETNYNVSGTIENPITYKAEGNVILRGAAGDKTMINLNGSYMIWDGFRIQGSEKGAAGLMALNGDSIIVRSCVFSDTAYYNAAQKTESPAAVTVRGTGAFLHNNVFGSDIYSVAALSVEAERARVIHNTFDGTLTAGGMTETALSALTGITVQNNIFSCFNTAITGLGAENGVLGGNVTEQKPGFMWQPAGDYALRSDSIMVDAGADAGFAYRGSGADVGAFESRFAPDTDPVELDGVIYRVFADTVTAINTTRFDITVKIPLGRPGLKLRSVGYGDMVTADEDGYLEITVYADEGIILQSKQFS